MSESKIKLVELSDGLFVNPSSVRAMVAIGKYDDLSGKFTGEVEGWKLCLGDHDGFDVLQSKEAILWKLTKDDRLLSKPQVYAALRDFDPEVGELLRGTVTLHTGYDVEGNPILDHQGCHRCLDTYRLPSRSWLTDGACELIKDPDIETAADADMDETDAYKRWKAEEAKEVRAEQPVV